MLLGRLSFGCELVAGHSLLISDLPTNGLDAATARAILTTMKAGCQGGMGYMCSLVQPSVDLFAMLDKVIVMSKGKTIYFGPPGKAEAYFNSIGFYRPASKAIPQFLEELASRPDAFWLSNPDNDLTPDNVAAAEGQSLPTLNQHRGRDTDAPSAAADFDPSRYSNYPQPEPIEADSAHTVNHMSTMQKLKMYGVARLGLGKIDEKWQQMSPDEAQKLADKNTAEWVSGLPDTMRRRAWTVLYQQWKHQDGHKAMMQRLNEIQSKSEKLTQPDALKHVQQLWVAHENNGSKSGDNAQNFTGGMDQEPNELMKPLKLRTDGFMMKYWYARYGSSPMQQLKWNVWRQILLTYRNVGLWRDIWIISTCIGLVIGSLFTRFNEMNPNESGFFSANGINYKDGIRDVVGLWFFVISYEGYNAVQLVPVLAAQRLVFYQQKRMSYYQTAAYFISLVILNIPIAAIEAFLLILPMYGLAGPVESSSTTVSGWVFITPIFWYVYSLVFLIAIVSRVWLMLLWSLAPNESIADVVNQLTSIVFTKLAGYFIPAAQIPSPWYWVYYWSFYTWALEGLAVETVKPLVVSPPCVPSPLNECRYQNGNDALQILYTMDPSRWIGWYPIALFLYFIGYSVLAYCGYWFVDYTAIDVPEYPDWNELEEEERRRTKEIQVEKRDPSIANEPLNEHTVRGLTSQAAVTHYRRRQQLRKAPSIWTKFLITIGVRRPLPQQPMSSNIVITDDSVANDDTVRSNSYHGSHRILSAVPDTDHNAASSSTTGRKGMYNELLRHK